MVETLMHMVGEFIKAVPSTPQARKDEFLDKVRDRVSYYQPRIENRCNVELGEIDIRDYKERYGHLCKIIIDEGFHGKSVFSKIDAGSFWIVMQVLRPFLSPIFGQSTKCYMNYIDSTIYIPFNLRSRIENKNPREREEAIDQGVIHELSHRLWEVLSGENLNYGSYDRLKRLWVEGFANYCDSNHFSDFYPKDYEFFEYRDEFYEEGRNKIKELVERYGQDIILEVPKRWREFDEGEPHSFQH